MNRNDTALDLTRIPFGSAYSAFLVYEENNCDGTELKPGLYLAARIQGGDHRREGGLVDIVPIVDGEPQTYSYRATPSLLTMTMEKGEIRLFVDSDDTARLCAHGVGIRLFAKFPFYSIMNATIMPGELLDLNLCGPHTTGGRYIMKAYKGHPTCYSKFNPATNGPEFASVELLPDEAGDLDFQIYMINPDERGFINEKPAESSLAEAEKRFADFAACYEPVPAEYEDLAEKSIYSVWLQREKPDKYDIDPPMIAEMIYTGKLSKGWANAFEQPLHALAMADRQEALKLIRNMYLHMSRGMLPGIASTAKILYQAQPPLQGVAVCALLDGGPLPKEDAASLYELMRENYQWWKDTHSDGKRRFFYNHRDELCLPGISYNALPFPLETPDLYTLMILYARALGKLADAVGEDASGWREEESNLLGALGELWNGDGYDCRDVRSGRRHASLSLMTCLPVMLGADAGEGAAEKLCAALMDEGGFLSAAGLCSESRRSELYAPKAEGRGAVTAWLQELFVCALRMGGMTEACRTAAKRYLDYSKKNGMATVIAPEGSQPVCRPGGAVTAAAGSAVLYLAKCL